MPQCCAFNCTKSGSFKFPKDPQTRKLWEIAVRRDNFQPSAHSRLCKDHFTEEDFVTITSFHHGVPSTKLKSSAVPSRFSFSKPQSKTSEARKERSRDRGLRKQVRVASPAVEMAHLEDEAVFHQEAEGTQLESVNIDDDINVGSEEIIDHLSDKGVVNDEGVVNDLGGGDEVDAEESTVKMCSSPQNQKLSEDSSGCTCCVGCTEAKQCRPLMKLEDFVNDEEGVHYYTGLKNYENCMMVFYTLCPEAYELIYKHSQVLKVPVKDQFFMTLMKLRRCTPDYELGKLFGCSKSYVSNIFFTWISFMAEMWSMLDVWPERDLIDYFMPQSFKKQHSKTRIIVDGTEIPIAKPNDARAQQASFSHYKNRYTLKVLVGATPGGLMSYCSDAYGGSTSDRAIVERCDLLNKCEAGDTIMADRGFVVNDLCANKGINLNIPTFMKGRTQLPSNTVLEDRNLASKRVHIERLINVVKTYKILKYELDKAYVPLGSEIIGVCAMLTNFRENIVTK